MYGASSVISKYRIILSPCNIKVITESLRHSEKIGQLMKKILANKMQHNSSLLNNFAQKFVAHTIKLGIHKNSALFTHGS